MIVVERRPELDGIRTLVVVGLVFFHSALVFDTRDDYYVKNAQTTEATTIVAALAVVWAMPALFLITGFGSWYSMRKRGAGGFARERLLRLGVPLVFATLTIIPIPPWLRLRADPAYHESYLQFLPRFFDVHLDLSDFPFILEGEQFETGHLWFVVLLLVFALLLALAVPRLPEGMFGRLAALTERRGVIFLAAVPIALICALVGLEEPFAGWSRWAYLIFFLYGFALATDERFRIAMRREARIAAGATVALMAVGMPGFLLVSQTPGADPFTDLTPLAITTRTLYGFAGWCCVVAILGLLDRPRPARPPGRIYGYAAYAVLPFYILHQPIVVAVAFVVVQWELPMAVKYVVIVTVSFALIIAVYDLLVRRTRVTRFLFGMREMPTMKS